MRYLDCITSVEDIFRCGSLEALWAGMILVELQAQRRGLGFMSRFGVLDLVCAY